MSDDTCACDMRHPDDDSPFQHHPYCIVGQRDDTPPHGIPRPDILMADLARVRDQLHAGIADDELDGLAMTWARLDKAKAELDVIVRDLSNRLGSMLADADYDPKQGYRLPNGDIVSHYQPAVRERWQGRALLRNLATTMVEPETGEVIPVIPLAVLCDIVPGVATDDQTSSKWKTTGLKNLDINPDDFRSREWGEPRVQRGPRR